MQLHPAFACLATLGAAFLVGWILLKCKVPGAMMVGGIIGVLLLNLTTNTAYETKELALAKEEERQNATLSGLEEIEKTRANLETRLAVFRKALDPDHLLTAFDLLVFETVVDRVIVGKYNDGGTTNPYSLRFVFKTG